MLEELVVVVLIIGRTHMQSEVDGIQKVHFQNIQFLGGKTANLRIVAVDEEAVVEELRGYHNATE